MTGLRNKGFSEKTLNELGDKVSGEDKAKVEEKLNALKAIKDSDDIEGIKKATEELTQEFYAVSSKVYEQANPQGAPGAGFNPEDMAGAAGAQQQGGNDDNVVDADYEVKEDK